MSEVPNFVKGDILTDDEAYADVLAKQIREDFIFLDDLDGRDLQILEQFHPELTGATE